MFSHDLYYHQALLIEPPRMVNKSNYICSKRFHLDYILEMYKTECCFFFWCDSFIWKRVLHIYIYSRKKTGVLYRSKGSYHRLARRVSFLSRRVSFLSRRVSFLSRRVSFLSRRVSFLSRRVSFLSRRVSFLSSAL